MRKIKQHYVMIKNLCMHISKIDIERERDRHKEEIYSNSNNYNINNNLY